MNKKQINQIVEDYLKIFPNENERLSIFLNYLKTAKVSEIVDWNNAKGHITCGAFLYCKQTKQFLTLHHKDLNMYLYPGGHMEKADKNPLQRAQLELEEESGVSTAEYLPFSKPNKLTPVDIDTHIIPENKKYNMSSHYHFDLRYLFVIDKKQKISIDANEMSSYKWISKKQLSKDVNYGKIINKLNFILKDNN